MLILHTYYIGFSSHLFKAMQNKTDKIDRAIDVKIFVGIFLHSKIIYKKGKRNTSPIKFLSEINTSSLAISVLLGKQVFRIA